jgi:hypothetical protein
MRHGEPLRFIVLIVTSSKKNPRVSPHGLPGTVSDCRFLAPGEKTTVLARGNPPLSHIPVLRGIKTSMAVSAATNSPGANLDTLARP